MLLEIALLIAGVPFILIVLGYLANKPFPLVLGGIGLLVAAVMVFASPIAFSQLANTTEASHVWNCSNETAVDCFGKPSLWSCNAYNETQCRDITGCAWSIQGGCYGTPDLACEELWDYGGEEKCLETSGCYIWNQTNPHTCDSYDTTFNYTLNALTDDENFILGLLLFGLGLFGLVSGALSFRD